MAGGSSLVTFTDFMKNTGPAAFGKPDKLVNDAVNQTWTFGLFMKGRGAADTMQGGSRIKDSVMFDEQSTFQHYKPNATFTPTNPQVQTDWYVDWRFSLDQMTWTDQQVDLNIPANTSGEGRFTQFKDEKKKLAQRCWTSMLKGIDACYWASPHGTSNYNAMEAQTGDTPYSIPAFITEDTSTYRPYQWTNIQSIAPASVTGWRNQVRRYNYADVIDAAGTGSGLLDAFDDMYLDLDFQPPPMHQEEFEPEHDWRRTAIFCSPAGKSLYIKVCRLMNDRFALPGGQDPAYPGVTYNGTKIIHVKALADAALYYGTSSTFFSELSSSLSASGAWSASDNRRGPRYYWVDANYLRSFFRSDRYFRELGPMTHPNQPMTHVKYIDLWWNTVCRSRKRQGIIGPGSTSGTAPA